MPNASAPVAMMASSCAAAASIAACMRFATRFVPTSNVSANRAMYATLSDDGRVDRGDVEAYASSDRKRDTVPAAIREGVEVAGMLRMGGMATWWG